MGIDPTAKRGGGKNLTEGGGGEAERWVALESICSIGCAWIWGKAAGNNNLCRQCRLDADGALARFGQFWRLLRFESVDPGRGRRMHTKYGVLQWLSWEVDESRELAVATLTSLACRSDAEKANLLE